MTVPGHAAFVAAPGGSVVAVGNFDGVHLGHRAVLGAVLAEAAALGAEPVVYTFDPAPTAVVAPARHQPRICTVEERVRRLLDAGVSRVVVEPFTPELSERPAAWFAGHVLGEILAARAIAAGPDFRFGRGREGTLDTFRRELPAARLLPVAPLVVAGAPVSSSRARKLIAGGDVAAAAALLGRAPTLSGTVVRGAQRGRTLGFPTANLDAAEELRPGDGVYAGLADVGGSTHLAAINIGARPTIPGAPPTVEAHLLGFDADLYGRAMTLHLHARLRDERRFPSLDALRAQLHADVAAARAALEPR